MVRTLIRRLIPLLFVFGGVLGGLSAQDLTLTVDVKQVLHDIPPTVYGANYGLLNTIPVDLFQQATDSGILFWRFPGGRVGDLNDLSYAQIDNFIREARLFGMEPAISVRLENGTIEAAADLVRYTNLEKGYNVKYWAVGNEPDLFDDFDPADIIREWRTIAEAMQAIDPNIILMGPDISQFTGEDGNAYLDVRHNYLREFLIANGDLLDVVTVHRYPFGEKPIKIDDLRQNAPEWTTYAQNLRRYVQEYAGRDLPIAFTEATSSWSATLGGEATGDSFYHAIWWADILGRLISEDVRYIAYFNMQSSDKLGGFGLLARYEVRPTYYTYQIYRQFGTQLIYTSSDDDAVRVYGAIRADGALTLIVVNLMDTDQTRTLNFIGTSGGEADVIRFDASHLAESIGSVTLSQGEAVTLPAQSITLYLLPSY